MTVWNFYVIDWFLDGIIKLLELTVQSSHRIAFAKSFSSALPISVELDPHRKVGFLVSIESYV